MQRQLANVMAVAGYLECGIYAYAASVSCGLMVVALTHLISEILIFNKSLFIRASAHACGAADLIAYLFY